MQRLALAFLRDVASIAIHGEVMSTEVLAAFVALGITARQEKEEALKRMQVESSDESHLAADLPSLLTGLGFRVYLKTQITYFFQGTLKKR